MIFWTVGLEKHIRENFYNYMNNNEIEKKSSVKNLSSGVQEEVDENKVTEYFLERSESLRASEGGEAI